MSELLVLGGGPAGVAAARTAAAMGATVSLVERAALGGVCVHAGCIPAGALHRTAEVLDQVSGAGTVGVAASPAAVDWTRMLSWVGSVVTRAASLTRASLEAAESSRSAQNGSAMHSRPLFQCADLQKHRAYSKGSS